MRPRQHHSSKKPCDGSLARWLRKVQVHRATRVVLGTRAGARVIHEVDLAALAGTQEARTLVAKVGPSAAVVAVPTDTKAAGKAPATSVGPTLEMDVADLGEKGDRTVAATRANEPNPVGTRARNDRTREAMVEVGPERARAATSLGRQPNECTMPVATSPVELLPAQSARVGGALPNTVRPAQRLDSDEMKTSGPSPLRPKNVKSMRSGRPSVTPQLPGTKTCGAKPKKRSIAEAYQISTARQVSPR